MFELSNIKKCTRQQIEEIEKAMKSTKSKNEYRRLQCLLLRIQQKMPLQQVSEIVGFNKCYISKLLSLYLKNGLDAIVDKPMGGNRRNMTFEEEEEFLKPFLERRNNGENVTAAEILQHYREVTGTNSASSTIYRLLERHNWKKSG